MLVAGGLARGVPNWIVALGAGIFAAFGAIILAIGIRNVTDPVCVRHATLDTFPDVSSEPLLREGSVVHGRLTHELTQGNQAWQFQPQKKHWRNDKRVLLGFGIPFLTMFSGVMSWIIQHEVNALGWPASIACGISITLLCGGSALLLIGLFLRASYRRLCWLNIPKNGNDLELDAPEEVDLGETDLAAAVKWLSIREINRHRLTIPRRLIRAVQLCPWKFTLGNSAGKSTTWAVQGSLVLKSPAEDTCCRIPLLLTSDFAGAAGLMQRLAATLDVPYLFYADAAGWQAEETAARQRPPMRIGGMQS